MEPPDHLRSHYQTFQALAYHLKLKQRNVKFSDPEQCLEMDFNVGDGKWRTIGVKDARDALKQAKARNSKNTRKDLADLLGNTKHADISDSSSSKDETLIEVSDSDDNQYKDAEPYSTAGHLSLFTANARSLVPKLGSLFDCMSERGAHFGIITETWINNGKQLTDVEEELKHAYSLGIISRRRDQNAVNGRAYGDVALVYRLSTTSFKRFEVPNADGYEVLASVGSVKVVKSSFFSVYHAKPHPTLAPLGPVVW